MRAGATGRALELRLIQRYLNDLGVANTEVFVESSVTSTNDVVRKYVVQNPDVAYVALAADEQTQGRGRLARTWQSTFGLGIAMSIAFQESQLNIPLTTVPLLSGLAVADALSKCGLQISVKWPNDLVVIDDNGALRKLGGILVQRFDECLVIGIGINLEHEVNQLPIPEATSASILGHRIESELLIAHILKSLEAIIEVPSEWLVRYRALCVTLGEEVRIQRIGQEPVIGTAKDIDDSGHLIVQTDEGVLQIESGDVEHLRRL